MAQPSSGVLAAAVGGILNAAIVLWLHARAGYPRLDSLVVVGTLLGTALLLGGVPTLVSIRTRLLTPVLGFLAVLVGTVVLELTTPTPEWSELNGHVVVDGPIHVANYANSWDVWLALCLLAGVLEFGLRRGYGLRDRHLRRLPTLPLSRGVIAWIVLGFASLLGVATMRLVLRSGIRPGIAALVVFVVVTAVTAVPLAALLARGILSPSVLFAVAVPSLLVIEVFTTTDSPVHILLFGPYAVVLAAVWAVEESVRGRVRGWDGGPFVGPRRRREGES